MSSDTTASLLLKKQLAELMKSPDSGECQYFILSSHVQFSLWTFAASFLNRFWTFKKKSHASLFTGFSAGLIDDNDIFRWEVLIIGPPGEFRQHIFHVPNSFFLFPHNTIFFLLHISDNFSSRSLRLTHNTQIRSMKVDFSKVSHAQLNKIVNESEANLVISNNQHTCFSQKNIHWDHRAWSSWQNCGIQISIRTVMVSQLIEPSTWITNFVLF